MTHSAELTRVRDTNGDGRADRFETVSDAWGYRNYHEYAFGSKFDAQGNLYVALRAFPRMGSASLCALARAFPRISSFLSGR